MLSITSRERINQSTSGWKNAAALLQSLHLYGSLAVCALGWATARLLGCESSRLTPLWFFGMLAAYNLDRLRPDPADAINVPRRTRRAAAHTGLSITLIAGSIAFLVALPLARGDWTLLGLTALGGLCAAGYITGFGRTRIKDLPRLKTLAPPAVVTAAFLVPPLLARQLPPWLLSLAIGIWLFTLLLTNMLVCDRRDIAGDRLSGVRSIPVLLGEKASLFLATGCVLLHGLAALLLARLDPAQRPLWLGLALAGPACALAVVAAARAPRSEAFYEWIVEGLFFVPPAFLCLAALL